MSTVVRNAHNKCSLWSKAQHQQPQRPWFNKGLKHSEWILAELRLGLNETSTIQVIYLDYILIQRSLFLINTLSTVDNRHFSNIITYPMTKATLSMTPELEGNNYTALVSHTGCSGKRQCFLLSGINNVLGGILEILPGSHNVVYLCNIRQSF